MGAQVPRLQRPQPALQPVAGEAEAERAGNISGNRVISVARNIAPSIPRTALPIGLRHEPDPRRARRRPLALAGGVDGERALAWVETETARTLAAFGGPAFERDRDTLAAMWDRKDKIPFVKRRGGEVYNYWVDADHKRGLWRRAPWAAYLGTMSRR